MVGIVGYGVYIPKYRLKVEEIARIWNEEAERIKESLMIFEKSVPGPDEDAATMAVEAARNAIHHSEVDLYYVNAIFVGSESHPYAVKPTATIVAEAISATPNLTAADFEFACKAGTTAVQCCCGLVKGGYAKYGMGIGSDTSQARPGDALEYTASAGAAAFIIGKDKDEIIAEIKDFYSYTTDTPDFWRREGESYPMHGARFTGQPAYFKHIVGAAEGLMEKINMKPNDFDYVVFHQPNGKFPMQAADLLGIDKEKVKQGLITPYIGNTYSAATLIGLSSVLDVAKPEERILAVSFGSGAGSDAFYIEVKDKIEEKRKRKKGKKVEDYLKKKEYIDYATYVKFRKKLKF